MAPSSSAMVFETVAAETSKPPICSSTSATRRVETPLTTISRMAAMSALSERCQRSKSCVRKVPRPSRGRTCGTSKESSPTQVFMVRGFVPLRWPRRWSERS